MHTINRKIAGAAGLFLFLIGSLIAVPSNTTAAQVPDEPPIFIPIDPSTAHDYCDNLDVPAGNEVAFQLFGRGVIVFRYDGHSWQPISQKALLFEPSFAKTAVDGIVGAITAGPTFDTFTGNRAVASVVAECSPSPSDAPWQLLEVQNTVGTGIFTDVTFVQRLFTSGGVPQVRKTTRVGDKQQIEYTADYVFYQSSK